VPLHQEDVISTVELTEPLASTTHLFSGFFFYQTRLFIFRLFAEVHLNLLVISLY
jgi:hypothetical protein